MTATSTSAANAPPAAAVLAGKTGAHDDTSSTVVEQTLSLRTPTGREAGDVGAVLELLLQQGERHSQQMAQLASQMKHMTAQLDALKRDANGLGA